jgi:SAM-dependent methyltransferase
MTERLFKILDHPWVYQLSQPIITMGGTIIFARRLKEILDQLPPAGSLLDVGCGPRSHLFRFGLRPFGVDVSPDYVYKYIRMGASGVAASAEALPFSSESFNGIWSIALFHHLPDPQASMTIQEFLRVCHSPGYVVIMDWVSPRHRWRRPLAAGIQRLDRGKFIRSQQEMEALLPDRHNWSIQRFTYTAAGLEMLSCLYEKR